MAKVATRADFFEVKPSNEDVSKTPLSFSIALRNASVQLMQLPSSIHSQRFPVVLTPFNALFCVKFGMNESGSSPSSSSLWQPVSVDIHGDVDRIEITITEEHILLISRCHYLYVELILGQYETNKLRGQLALFHYQRRKRLSLSFLSSSSSSSSKLSARLRWRLAIASTLIMNRYTPRMKLELLYEKLYEDRIVYRLVSVVRKVTSRIILHDMRGNFYVILY